MNIFDDNLYKEIYNSLSSGSYCKKDIMDDYSLINDEGYEKFIEKILKRCKDLERGEKKVGGLRLKDQKSSECKEERSTQALEGCSEWQKEVVEILESKLKSNDLEDLLGSFKNVLLQYNKQIWGKKSPGTKIEMACAIVTFFGEDLLKDKERREIICKSLGGDNKLNPSKWIPKKLKAIEFVKSLGLPIELAGRDSEERKPDIEQIKGVKIKDLEPFQEEIKKKVKGIITEGKKRAMLSLPTGAGKTRVAVEIALDWITHHSEENATILWLAHTEELCEQAAQTFIDLWGNKNAPPTDLVRFWGSVPYL